MPIIELRRTNRTKPESRILNAFSFNTTSQFGEDGIIREIFNRIGSKNRWCVEFGAWDGKHLSNTWSLIQDGWSAVLAEGEKSRAERLREQYKHSDRIHVKECFVGWDGEFTLDNILSTISAPFDFDLLSIDIDGNDWHVWSAVRKYKPRVVVIEFNPTASNNLYFVQDAAVDINQGASLLAVIDLARSKGYELVATTNCNALFVTREEFSKIGIEDNSIDAMHDASITAEIAHGYDGTIIAAGHLFLSWQGVQLSQEDYQVIPKMMRRYQYSGDG